MPPGGGKDSKGPLRTKAGCHQRRHESANCPDAQRWHIFPKSIIKATRHSRSARAVQAAGGAAASDGES
jgi:hypothetical protein